jgi:glycosyltransferase involved in cell wall biosynthesis
VINASPRFSICVPVCISHEDQLSYLEELLHSISNQTFSNFELIVSDDSDNISVSALCSQMKVQGLRVKYISSQSTGISQNLNYCIKNATGDLVKIMFQDDFFFTSNALEEINSEFEKTGTAWYVSACNHYSQDNRKYYEEFFPRENSNLLQGHNTISSPSVVTLRRASFETFSKRLTYLLDCEWYLRMSHKHGMPSFGRSIHVTNRVHAHQATNWAKEYLEREIEISTMMHSEARMGSRICLCN